MGRNSGRDVTSTSRLGLSIGLLCGTPVMLVGGVGLLRHTDATPPSSYLKFLVGGDIVHDLVVAPIVALVAFFVVRRVPAIARAPLRAALFGSAVVVAIAWPGIRQYGRMRAPDNLTVQPLNYATSTLTAVGVVIAVATVWFVVELVRSRRTVATSSPPAHTPDS
jgi:hypothetical protein